MGKTQNENTEIHQCEFEAQVLHTDAVVKFQCKMFVLWKNASNKTFCRTTDENVTAKDGKATFNEVLSFQTYLLYDKIEGKYLKKETSLCLILISARKPDEEKLVGRVTVDLSQILNESLFGEIKDYPLTFCSVKGSSLTFNATCLQRVKTNIKPNNLDMDEFSSNVSRLFDPNEISNHEENSAVPIITKEFSQEDIKKEEPKLEPTEENTEIQKETLNEEVSSPENVEIERELITNVKREEESSFQKADEEKKEDLFENIENNNNEEPKEEIYVNETIENEQENQMDVQLNQNQEEQKEVEISHQVERDSSQIEEETEEIASAQVETVPQIESMFEKDEGNENEDLEEERDKFEVENQTNLNYESLQRELLEVKIQNDMLVNENEKLVEIIAQMNMAREEFKEDTNTLTNNYEELEQHFKKMESDKNDVIQELILQNQETTKKLHDYQNKLNNKSNEDLEKAMRKAAAAVLEFEKSENLRLEIESELLEMRFELSEIKVEKEALDTAVRNKDEELERLYKYIEDLRASKNQEEMDRSLYRSFSLMSDKERESYNEEIEALKKKIEKLIGEINFNHQIKENLTEFNQVYEETANQRDVLLDELNHMKEQKEEWIRSKLNIEEVNEEYGHVDEDIENIKKKNEYLVEERKALESEIQRYLTDKSKMEDQIAHLTNDKAELEENLRLHLTSIKTDEITSNTKVVQEKEVNEEPVVENGNGVYENMNEIINGEVATTYSEIEMITGLKMELKSSLEELARVREVLDERQNEFEALNAKYQNLQNEFTIIKDSEERLLSKNSNTANELQTLRQEISLLRDKQLTFVQETSINNQKYDKLDIDVNEYKQNIGELKAQNGELVLEVQGKELKMQQIRAELEEIKSQFKLSEGKQIKAKELNESLKIRISELEVENSELRMKVSNLVTDNSSSKNNANKEVENLKLMITEKDAYIESKVKRINELIQNLDEHELKIQELEERNARFSDKETQMRQNILILEEESRKIQNMFIEKDQNEEYLAQLIEERESEVEYLRNQLYSHNASPNGEDKNRNAEKFRTNIKENISSFETKGGESSPDVHNKISELHDKILELENLYENERSKVINLELEINGIKREKNELTLEIERLRKSENPNSKITEILKNLQSKEAQLCSDLQLKEAQIRKLQAEIEELKNSKNEKSTIGSSTHGKAEQEQKIRELMNENELMETHLNNQEQKIQELNEKLGEANNRVNNLVSQLEDNEVEKMNVELHKQFQIKDANKSEIRKSDLFKADEFSHQDIVESCLYLKGLLAERGMKEKEKGESMLEMIMSKNIILEGELNRFGEEKNTIKEDAMKLSMEFQRIKSIIMKGKGSFTEKNDLLSSLKPCEVRIKGLVEISERFFDAQFESENY